MELRVLEYANGVKVLQVWVADTQSVSGSSASGYVKLNTGNWVNVPVIKIQQPTSNI